ncbi:hypothetical protein EV144_107165 [Flavobacterium sp. 270]|uniref:hypothetical protein n=1 Tax=Flavobacterium sp. 270 TaxID=2512114 RepID=UPI0010659D30|nr:hypothetical protein [Flavobacterium sp. 270]TDW45972.1 hypothetical protein EV144_107165 [Flavobacterium sp. 270]
MIKSYKIIIFVQIILVSVCGFVFRRLQDIYEPDSISVTILLLVGALVLISLTISVVIQKLIVVVINSDSTKIEAGKNISNDEFWRISFFVILMYGFLTLLFSIIVVVSNWDIGFTAYDFMDRILISFAILIVSSLVIGLLFRIRESVCEIAKILGFLMIFISIIIFLGSLFVASSNALMFRSYNEDSIVGFFENLFKGDDLLHNSKAVTVESSEAQNEIVSESEGEGEGEESDYYDFYDMSFPDVDINDNLNYGSSKAQGLFKLFLSRCLKLEDNQSFNGFRTAIQQNVFYGEYEDIKVVDKKLRRNPTAIREAFDGYSPLLYAFLSDKIYFESNLNLLVDALINSHNDIYGTENPEESLNKIYKTMIFGEKKEFPDYCYEKISQYVSENVSNAINKDAKIHLDKDNYIEGYGSKYSTVWIYSFWGRRYKEKNIDVVFEILKEVKKHYEENDRD